VTELAERALVPPRDRLWPAVVASVAVHLVVMMVATAIRPGPALDPSQKPLTARLVRLGEVRPPEYLPRKEAAPPPAAEAPTPAPVVTPAVPKVAASVPATAAAPKAAPARQALPGPVERSGRPGGARLSNVLSEMRQEIQAGSPEGDPLGDSSEAEGDQYQAQVIRALRQNYRLPSTLSDRERLFLTGTVTLFVDSSGHIIDHKFEQRSGNAAFDDALERAVQETRLPPPPPEQRDAYRNTGVRVIFKI
jgi:colicin import membrane protein